MPSQLNLVAHKNHDTAAFAAGLLNPNAQKPEHVVGPNGKKAEVVMKKILAGKNIPNGTLYGEDLVKHFKEIGKELLAKYG